MYSVWKSENGNGYERMQYVAFKTLEEAKRFVWDLRQSAKLYLGLHDTSYTFQIRRY